MEFKTFSFFAFRSSLLCLFVSLFSYVNAEVVPPYKRCPDAGCQFFSKGDFLYWSIWKDPLEYTWKMIPVGPVDPLQRRVDQEIKSLKSSWEPGFRISIGTLLNSGWNLILEWTDIHTQLHGRISEGPPILATLYIQTFDGVPLRNGGYRAKEAIASWKLDYDTLDFTFGYEYYISSQLHFYPKIGVTLAWIDQKTVGQYNSVFQFSPDVVSRGDQKGTTKEDAWGIGPKFGFGSFWKVVPDFQLLGEINGGFPWINFNESFVRSVENDEAKPMRENYSEKLVNNHQKIIWPFVQLGGGVDWNYCFKPSLVSLGFQLKYEALYWWESPTTRLDLQGVVVSGRLQF